VSLDGGISERVREATAYPCDAIEGACEVSIRLEVDSRTAEAGDPPNDPEHQLLAQLRRELSREHPQDGALEIVGGFEVRDTVMGQRRADEVEELLRDTGPGSQQTPHVHSETSVVGGPELSRNGGSRRRDE